MTFNLQKILESKREFRRGLALLPIVEKLRLLDALRERQLTLGSGVGYSRSDRGPVPRFSSNDAVPEGAAFLQNAGNPLGAAVQE